MRGIILMLTSPSYKGLEIRKCWVCNHAVFIDNECDHPYKKLQVKKCPTCQSFIPLHKYRNAIYCSVTCRNTAKQRRKTVKRNPTKEIRKCPVCNKQFLGNGKKPYCSPECHLWALSGDKNKVKAR